MMKSATFQRRFFERLGPHLHLSELFEYLPEVYLYVKNERSQFVKVNRALANLHGFSREEQMVGKTDLDFHPRHLAEQYMAEDKRVMHSRVALPNQVWLVPDHQGALKWYISSKIPLFGQAGRVIGIAGAMRDFEKAGWVLQPYQEMEHVLAHVLNHYGDRIAVNQLAELVHLSVSQFERKFKRLFHMTPQQYILRVRINAACQALTTSQKSVAQIAAQTGFYDQSYFTKQFRKQMRLTPLRYRRAASLPA